MNPFAEILRFGALAAMVIGVLWWAKSRRCLGFRENRRLRVIEAASLGRNRAACIIEADGHRLLLGVAEGSITLLKELSDETSGKEHAGGDI